MQPLALFGPPSSTTTASTPKQKLTRVAPQILEALRCAQIRERDELIELELPRLSLKTYAKAKELLAICGFIWSTRGQTHRGSQRAKAMLADVAASGYYDDTVRALEFYATSPAQAETLAGDLAEHVWSATVPRILEPSAGDGALVEAVLAATPEVAITAVEIDPARAAELRDRFAGDERVRIVCSDILSFDEAGWDGVIMNPPFADSAAHIQRVIDLARIGAYVVGIAMLTRRQDRDAAIWLHDNDAIVWPTDPDAFEGTTIAASCFCLRKGPSYLERLCAALEPHPSVAKMHIRELTRISRDLHVLFTNHCNGDIEGEPYDTAVATNLARARALTAHEGITIAPAWDPRAGHGFGLKLPSGLTNDWGRCYIIVPPAHELDVAANQLDARRSQTLAAAGAHAA